MIRASWTTCGAPLLVSLHMYSSLLVVSFLKVDQVTHKVFLFSFKHNPYIIGNFTNFPYPLQVIFIHLISFLGLPVFRQPLLGIDTAFVLHVPLSFPLGPLFLMPPFFAFFLLLAKVCQ
ncbi:hypothetical protein AAZX31_19G143700 [Glycine max]|uniref:Uncharacterized protein n=1 Tax=Glycine max TaxID=3847 RepID=A0A0R0ENM1_SOYBN|nr:hypothetical protein JHK86_053600 [Glycine max]KAG4916107.1 hypothetical protein JHK87_053664 [Glycine soja]KAG4928064.1 hypothetical protein JHK85_054550 [Glycine max]KAG5083587.1 hypothetical protein JHK84_053625 [Glycine max]KAG5086355.1 hypothetical protein JHK82_053752 [Glycine max]